MYAYFTFSLEVMKRLEWFKVKHDCVVDSINALSHNGKIIIASVELFFWLEFESSRIENAYNPKRET